MDITATDAPAEISENDQKRADLTAKREYLANLRQERENLQTKKVEDIEALAIDRESEALDAEIRYEMEAARILLDAEQEKKSEQEVEDGVYQGQEFVDETVYEEPELPQGSVSLPPDLDVPDSLSPDELEPPAPAVESDTSLFAGDEVTSGPDTEQE